MLGSKHVRAFRPLHCSVTSVLLVQVISYFCRVFAHVSLFFPSSSPTCHSLSLSDPFLPSLNIEFPLDLTIAMAKLTTRIIWLLTLPSPLPTSAPLSASRRPLS